MEKELAWGIVICLVIIIFQLADINDKLKRCAGLLAECANSLEATADDDYRDDDDS
jgi:hypothetical protein